MHIIFLNFLQFLVELQFYVITATATAVINFRTTALEQQPRFLKYHNRSKNRNRGFLKTHNRSITTLKHARENQIDIGCSDEESINHIFNKISKKY